MSSRTTIELICDDCAYVETFVHLERNHFGAVAKIDLPEAAKVRGWTIERPIDTSVLVRDYCLICSGNRRAKKVSP